jgi:Family of unknown function (DUF5305)
VRVLAVVLVVVALAAVVALYNVATVVAAPSSSTTTTPVLAYDEDVQFGYLATLSPNALNETAIGPGEGVIYLSLVKNLSVSYNVTLNVTPPATVEFSGGYDLIVSAPGNWNYTFAYAFGHATGYNDITSLTYTEQTYVNLTAIQAFIRAVGNQTGVVLSSYTIYYEATLSATMASGGHEVGSVLFPALAFQLTSAELIPGPLGAQTAGGLNETSTVLSPTRGSDLLWALVILAVVLAVLGVVAYLAAVDRRRPDAKAQLRALTAPYKDAIAVTWTAPKKENVVAIRDWEDLVHVADMLGRPILRYEHWRRDPPRTLFYVLDGSIQYIYLVPIGGRRIEDDLADLT